VTPVLRVARQAARGTVLLVRVAIAVALFGSIAAGAVWLSLQK
jgi:hypothetical protein